MTVSVGDDLAAERAAFRFELVQAGVLIPTSEDGLWGRSAVFEQTVHGISQLVMAAGVAEADGVNVDPPESLRFAPVMPRVVLERADYLASFPQLIGSVSSFAGNDSEHAELLSAVARGAPWTTTLQPTQLVLCSAACHPYFPTINRPIPEEGLRADVLGTCFRNEPSPDPARMQSFRQHEQIYVGTPAGALAHRERWVEVAVTLLQSLGLHVTTEIANDPFFGRTGRLLAAGQRQQTLKVEVLGPVSSSTSLTAIASANLHMDHFGRAFGIVVDGAPAHTACVGFGLERIALGLFRAHGMRTGSWPDEVRRRLSL